MLSELVWLSLFQESSWVSDAFSRAIRRSLRAIKWSRSISQGLEKFILTDWSTETGASPISTLLKADFATRRFCSKSHWDLEVLVKSSLWAVWCCTLTTESIVSWGWSVCILMDRRCLCCHAECSVLLLSRRSHGMYLKYFLCDVFRRRCWISSMWCDLIIKYIIITSYSSFFSQWIFLLGNETIGFMVGDIWYGEEVVVLDAIFRFESL